MRSNRQRDGHGEIKESIFAAFRCELVKTEAGYDDVPVSIIYGKY
jgi:hypothetical protein